jgi:hypothetical protein
MLLGRPWLKDAKMFHDLGNNTITIQGADIVRTIPITKKFGTLTKHPEVLICYDFHSGISDEDLMFAIELGLFSIGTIVVPTSIWSNQPVKLITSTGLNLVEHVFKPSILSNIFIKSILVRPIKIDIPFNTFFQPEVRKMEIDETPTRIKVQNLRIAGWTITEEEQSTMINWVLKKTYNRLKSVWIWNLLSVIN